MIRDVLKLTREKDLDVGMHVTSRRDIESSMEYIDLLTPKLSSEIVLEVQNRSTIGAEYIFNGFKEQNYFAAGISMQNKLIRLLPR